ELIGLRARLAVRDQVLAKADAQAFLRRDFASREDDLERAALAHDAGQAHGTAIDERHAPAPAIDAEIGVFLHHAEIAPERELHAPRDRGTRDRRDHRLVELEARGPEGTARNLAAVAASARRRNVELAQGMLAVERAHVLEIPPRAEGAAFAVEH